MSKIENRIQIIILAAITLGTIIPMIYDWHQCTTHGGLFVRTLIWFECVR